MGAGSLYSIAEHILDLSVLADIINQFPVRIIGHSLGAITTLLYAGVFPERVEKLVAEHGKLPLDKLTSAFSRVSQISGPQRAKIAARYLRDFLLYYRDMRRLEVLNAAMEKINLLGSGKLSELSKLNGTLYAFLLASEEKSQAEKPVARHVIVKADVRDSSRVTRSLLERDMNPASYFSLNFYDPVNKLLPKYAANKVFVEGDAPTLQGDHSIRGRECPRN